ncbi:MAG: tetratricopeptide repeat protein [Tepidisphaeraceae bacterium]
MQQVTLEHALKTAMRAYLARDLGQADAVCRTVLKVCPENAHALHILGAIANDSGDLAGAYDLFKRTTIADPVLADAFNNLSVVCRGLAKFDEAIDAAGCAIALDPRVAAYQNNLGIAHVYAARHPEARRAFERAIQTEPEFAEAHVSLAIVLLMLGELQEGWREHEWRWSTRNFTTPRRNFSRPQWTGQDLTGRTILLHAEQGYGDTFQFIRYAPLLAARGARVLLQSPADIAPLLCTAGGIDAILTGETSPPFDFHCPLLSVPLAYGTTLATIPATVPYLRADPQRVIAWADRFHSDHTHKIGLVWAGRPTHRNDRERSIMLQALAPLAGVPGVSFYSLQKGQACAQLRDEPTPFRVVDLDAELRSFLDTAAVIENLDLVISVDTSVAHLAGAMGHPVWVMLPHMPDWRWLLERRDSPWYPTMRLFRQRAPNDWSAVVSDIASALKALPSR